MERSFASEIESLKLGEGLLRKGGDAPFLYVQLRIVIRRGIIFGRIKIRHHHQPP